MDVFYSQKTNTVYHSSPKAFSRAFLEVSDSDNLQREIDPISRSESTLWDFQNNVWRFELQKRSRLGYFVSKSFFSKHSLHSNLVGTIVRLLGCLVAEISPTVMSDPSDQSKQRIFMILNGSPETAPIPDTDIRQPVPKSFCSKHS